MKFFLTPKSRIWTMLLLSLSVQSITNGFGCQAQDVLTRNLVLHDGALTIDLKADTTAGTMQVDMAYAGIGWLAFAFSEDNQMVDSVAVVVIPDATNVYTLPEVYSLTAREIMGVTVVDYPLTSSASTQNSTHTTMSFVKPLVQDGFPTVSTTESNFFLYAIGSSNDLGYHSLRESLEVNLSEGENTEGHSLELEEGDLQLVFTTDENAGTLTVSMTYVGLNWIAIAFSEDQLMLGSVAVIALPGAAGAIPQKYDLNSRTDTGVILSSQQTLQDASLNQNNTHTTMTFTKLLQEDGEPTISLTESNHFLYATGSTNELGYHAIRKAFAFNFADVNGTPAVPTFAPVTAMPSLEPTLALVTARPILEGNTAAPSDNPTFSGDPVTSMPSAAVDQVTSLEPTYTAPTPAPVAPIAALASSSSSSSSSSNTGPIVGGAIGGLALICITAVVIVIVQKRDRPNSSAKQEPNVLALSSRDRSDDHNQRDAESQLNPAPTNNEEPTREATLSAYAIHVPLQEGNTGPRPASSSGARKDSTPNDHSNLPVFKDQVRTVRPPQSSYIPTVDATPVEDSKVELDAPGEGNDIGNTPTRQQGIEPYKLVSF